MRTAVGCPDPDDEPPDDNSALHGAGRPEMPTPEQMAEARRINAETTGEFVNSLLRLGISAKAAYEAAARELGIPFVDLTVFKPDPAAIALVPAEVARRLHVMPLKRDGSTLYMASSDPKSLSPIEELYLATSCAVRIVMAVPEEIDRALELAYSV